MLVLMILFVVNIMVICCKDILGMGIFCGLVVGYYCKHPIFLLVLFLIDVVNILMICCKDILGLGIF
jgi:hypothetical protein